MAVLRPEDALRWRLRSTQRLVDRTLRDIEHALTISPAAVSYSGGKDSLVLAALARQVDPAIPIVWGDEEAEPPEALRGVAQARRFFGGRFWTVVRPLDHTADGIGTFRQWSVSPPVREPLPGSIILDGRMSDWLLDQGMRSLVGVRRQETAARRYGRLINQRTIKPLLDWTDADIWAAIAGLDLPLSPLYGALMAAGWPRERCKTVPLIYALDGSYGPYRRLWPDLCQAVEARIIPGQS